MDLETLCLIFGSSTQYRRIKAMKNALIGRRTVSNLYWSLQYDMLDFVDSLHGQQFGDDQQVALKLSQAGLIVVDDRLQFKLTKKGQVIHDDYTAQLLPLKYLAVSSRVDVNRFAQRFVFASQIVSEYSYANHKYYPQSLGYYDDQLLKHWFIANKQQNLPKQFHDLLTGFLSRLDNDQRAEVFVQSLIGHHFSGMTEDQLADSLKTRPTIIEIQWLQLYGMLLLLIQKHPQPNPFMQLTAGLEKPVISNSAKKTFELYRQQTVPSIDQIVAQRRIKQTTVYEHLIEAAIMAPVAQFPYQSLIQPKTFQQLALTQPDDVANWAFDQAAEEVPGLSFFEFRLFQIYRSKTAHDD